MGSQLDTTGQLLWLQKKKSVALKSVGKWPMAPFLCELCKQFPDDFVGSVTSFRSIL